MTATDGVPTVDQVIERLREIGAGAPPADGVTVFNRMYLTVTELVGACLGQGYFVDPDAMAVLDAVFAERYLLAVDALAAGQRVPACWRPLFELRAHPGVHPLQFALAGMNAHIEHDLPLAVVDTCRLLGRAPADLAEDYDRINALLARAEAEVREQLMPGPDALESAGALTHLVSAWSIDAARDAAWASALALWELRRVPFAASALAAALDGSVGLVGRALLTPLDPADAADIADTENTADTEDTEDAAPSTPVTGPAGRLPLARSRPAVAS
ncbi:DUF5995 family protein [Kitasatospora sp. NPDC004240]